MPFIFAIDFGHLGAAGRSGLCFSSSFCVRVGGTLGDYCSLDYKSRELIIGDPYLCKGIYGLEFESMIPLELIQSRILKSGVAPFGIVENPITHSDYK
uniref:Uncharacterized protein n=1 Tax=Nelumbo nucifera TaxID=4432 RepID=A0A822YP28_NELNU|nr:TPA_asm: hypothetical protein HUJ06_012714 [Nelumbo nucifera]